MTEVLGAIGYGALGLVIGSLVSVPFLMGGFQLLASGDQGKKNTGVALLYTSALPPVAGTIAGAVVGANTVSKAKLQDRQHELEIRSKRRSRTRSRQTRSRKRRTTRRAS